MAIYSEVLGVFKKRKDCILELLKFANYREKDGKLTQYLKPCDDYESFTALYNEVDLKGELVDVDVYRIIECSLK